MSGNFPLVNENEMVHQAKLENESKWKTKKGFDTLNKRENWNEHPKQPDLSKREELRIPYFQEILSMKQQL